MKACKTTELIMSHDQVVTKTDLAEFRTEVKAEVRVLKWMVGVTVALTWGMLWPAIA